MHATRPTRARGARAARRPRAHACMERSEANCRTRALLHAYAHAVAQRKRGVNAAVAPRLRLMSIVAIILGLVSTGVLRPRVHHWRRVIGEGEHFPILPSANELSAEK